MLKQWTRSLTNPVFDEDEMVGRHHDSMDISLSNLRVGDGQGSLVGCSPWGRKESDMTEQLN